MPLKLVFMGTPRFSVPVLEAVLAAEHDVVAVYSQPPRRAGRGMAEKKSPIHEAAERRGLAVFTPLSLKGVPEQNDFSALGADAVIVVAYGLLLPKPVLDAPRHGCFNVHASALPRWRGAAPIQRAIMAGDKQTAVMVMRMEEGLDTGPVCATQPIAIGDDETSQELHDRLSLAGAELMVEALAELEKGKLSCAPQLAEGITYAAKIDKAEAHIDFTKEAGTVHNLIRGLSPFPGAWLEASPTGAVSERIKILRSHMVQADGRPGDVLDDQLTIACGSGAVRLLEVQRAGKRPVDSAQFLRGFPLNKGMRVS